MNRVFLAALALACVYSPALAAAGQPFDTQTVFAHALFALIGGSILIAAVLYAVNRLPWLAVAAVSALAALAVGTLSSLPAMAETAATVAQPATDTAVVTVPLGTWVASYASAIVEVVTALVMLIVTYALRALPASIGTVLKGLITQQLVEKAISFGMNTVEGATKGKALSFDVGNAVLANALNYIVSHAPGWLVSWTGGESAIRDHIIALLPVAEGASLATSTPTAQGATTTDPVKLLG